jgi:hypothetical protein
VRPTANFSGHSKLREHVLGYLQNLIWHRWEIVLPIFQHGLGMRLPSVKSFQPALLTRHDIVHRCGRTKSGLPVSVTLTEIDTLFNEIEKFAVEVNRLLSARKTLSPVKLEPGGN